MWRFHDFFEKNRYTKEEAEIEAEKLRAVAGEVATSEDYQIAEHLVENEKNNAYNAEKNPNDRPKEKIFVWPAQGDKRDMVGLDTKDPKLFRLFNRVAGIVMKQYQGFHQVGPWPDEKDPTGFTAWEIWYNPEKVHPSEIVKEIYEKMRILAGD
ncbi:MAG: hypothetical protein HYT12_02955 [Candidatus Liptonbacteria bacterium]|nr:hypothetical protein [Candidatus Liptonbacteria bacterium]